jgi:hypothetical protein
MEVRVFAAATNDLYSVTLSYPQHDFRCRLLAELIAPEADDRFAEGGRLLGLRA